MFCKIIIMLLLSVFLVKTTSSRFLSIKNLQENSLQSNIAYFILATMNFINIFYNNYGNLSSQKYPLKKIISETLTNSINEMENIKMKIEKDLDSDKEGIVFFSFENLYLLFFITILSLLSVL
ncbi:MAG: hypothetical protein K8S23_07355 [Candidatus Cloacimonetes bacterium]|nr:hypothetical protein [Candidatus Cloacimonadota bacterium]